MKARHHLAVASGLSAALALGAVAIPVYAQRNITQDPNAKQLLVVTFRPGGKDGIAVAEELRDRMPRVIPLKQVWPIPTESVRGNQEPSGFPYDIPLNVRDAGILANRLRAHYLIDGTVRLENGVYRVKARMIVPENTKLIQPLDEVSGRRPDHAANAVAEQFKEARAHWDHAMTCYEHVRNKRFREGIAPAKAAIAAYPKTTVGRVCLASAYANLDYPPDSILPLVNEVLAMDSTSWYALEMGYVAYKKKGESEKSIEYISKLLTLDPNNVPFQQLIVEDLASSRQYDIARRFIDDAVAKNPGDPDLIRLRFKILVYTTAWKDAIAAGEELLRTDTSATDTTFFINLAAAYKADSQPQQAAQAIAKGIAKYPDSPRLYTIYSQYLREAGQIEQSIAAARKAIELNPQDPGTTIAYLTIAQTFIDQGQPDSAGATLRTAARGVRTADDSLKVSQFVLLVGQRVFAPARADTATERISENRAKIEEAVQWFAYSDSISPSPSAKFHQGWAAYEVASRIAIKEIQAKQKELGPTGVCELARRAQPYMLMAQVKMNAGGSVSPQTAQQILMQTLQVVNPHLDLLVKTNCK